MAEYRSSHAFASRVGRHRAATRWDRFTSWLWLTLATVFTR